MFKRSLGRLYCTGNSASTPSRRQTGGRIQPIGINLNQEQKKRLSHLETIEKIKEQRKLQKNNRANEDPIIKKAYAELEEEGFFENKNREDY